MALEQRLKTRDLVLNDMDERRIVYQMQRLARRLTHHSQPVAEAEAG
jgi:hypothetical protein